MKLLKITALVAAGVLSTGCATEMAWQRADGGPVVGYAFQRDSAHCRRRALHHGEAATEVMRRCMARRGYVWAAAYYNGYNGYNGYRRYHDDD